MSEQAEGRAAVVDDLIEAVEALRGYVECREECPTEQDWTLQCQCGCEGALDLARAAISKARGLPNDASTTKAKARP